MSGTGMANRSLLKTMNPLHEFLIKTPSGNSAASAIKSLLEIAEGNRLTITSGYVGGKDELVELSQLVAWLRSDSSRQVHLIFGVRGIYEGAKGAKAAVVIQGKKLVFKPDEKSYDYLVKEAGHLFDYDSFPIDLIDRLNVWGVAKYHAKAVLLSHEDAGGKEHALAALMGSSNFTESALHKPFGFEMDLYMQTTMETPDPLLDKFADAFRELLRIAHEHLSEDATDFFKTLVVAPIQHMLYHRYLNAWNPEEPWDLSIEPPPFPYK